MPWDDCCCPRCMKSTHQILLKRIASMISLPNDSISKYMLGIQQYMACSCLVYKQQHVSVNHGLDYVLGYVNMSFSTSNIPLSFSFLMNHVEAAVLTCHGYFFQMLQSFICVLILVLTSFCGLFIRHASNDEILCCHILFSKMLQSPIQF